ncbi:MAG: hypothetical protein ERJ69_03215 [Aphanocapsa feldmannii 288cV]|nr:MAG: hypothetical protein ERJ69_03215 [Aphanocapsa feldmannii 288cV]
MPSLTTGSLSQEILLNSLLTIDELTTGLTVLACDAAANPQQSPRLRALLDELLAALQACENELGTYSDPGHLEQPGNFPLQDG